MEKQFILVNNVKLPIDASFQEAFSVKAVDTTGAGDTFTGYFVDNWSQGEAAPLCLERAARAAAISVSRPGAAVSIPVKDEVYGECKNNG